MRTLLLLALSLIATATLAADRVRLRGGGSVTGSITEVSREGLRIQTRDGDRNVSLEAIKLVTFDGDPPALTQARLNIEAGGHKTALGRLSRIEPGDLTSDFARQDLSYYTAYCQARVAIAGAGDAKVAERALTDFVRGARESFHYYGAVETLGDLMVAGERYDRAEKFYKLLAKAKAPSLRARARTLAGRVSHARGKHDEAIRRYDAALALKPSSEAMADEHRAARLGKAESLAARGDLRTARELVAEVVRPLAEDDMPSQAAAYNTLGRVHEAAGDSTGALLAYLHTDLLFNEDASTHAEALSHLAPLWRKAGDDEASRDARDRLQRRYGSSRWARGAED